ncbi:MAG: sensor histidine kinase [Candidatus Thorarchaeota archaeon]|nr:sensor histidine kinase [Candidatus Thorarchaeota archaeon]
MSALRYRETKDAIFGVLLFLFLAVCIRTLGTATSVLLSPESQTTFLTEAMAANIKGSLFHLSILLSIAQYSKFKPINIDCMNREKVGIGIVAVAATVLFLLHIYFVNIYSNVWMSVMVGTVEALLSLLLLSLISISAVLYREAFQEIDVFRYTMSTVIIAIAVIVLLLFPSNLLFSMTISITYQAIGITLLYLSLFTPYFERIGFSYLVSSIIGLIVSIITFIPFLVILGVEIYIGTLYFYEVSAFVITNLAMASVSAIMAYLLHGYAKIRSSRIFNPLVAFFGAWTTISVVQIAIYATRGYPVEISAIPHIFGEICAAISLTMTIEYARDGLDFFGKWSVNSWLIGGIIFAASFLLIGYTIQSYLLNVIPALSNANLGSAVLLIVTVANFGIFIHAFAILVGKNEGEISLEIIAVCFVLLMTGPHFLKAVFPAWTLGWWIAQVFMSLGFAIGPAIIGYQYLNAIEESENSEKKATLLSDILLHDINNYHHILLGHLDLATERKSQKTRDNLLENAKSTLREAIERIEKMKKVVSLTESTPEKLEPMHLTSILERSVEVAVASLDVDLAQVDVRYPDESYYVLANDLLLDVFVNLFKNAIESSPEEIRIEVSVFPANSNPDCYWNVTISDYGRGIPPEKRKDLFTRFMNNAKGTGLGLYLVKTIIDSIGGDIKARNRVEDDYTQGTTFQLKLQRPSGVEC